jgi:predicted outer membrane protein
LRDECSANQKEELHMRKAGAALLAGSILLAAAGAAEAQVGTSGIGVRKDPGGGVASGSQVRVENISAGDIDLVRTMTAGNVLSHIMVSDSMEVEIARLGEQRIQDAELRSFAARLAADHGNNLRAGWEVAASQNVGVQRAAWDDAAQHMQLTLQRLRAMSAGPEFDRMFLREQISHHHMAVQRLRAIRDGGAPAPVSAHVNATLAAIEDHLRQGQQIAARLGLTTVGPDGAPLHDHHGMHRPAGQHLQQPTGQPAEARQHTDPGARPAPAPGESIPGQRTEPLQQEVEHDHQQDRQAQDQPSRPPRF